MAIDNVRNYLKKWDRDKDILEFEASSATVELAAQALGVEPARIAKTLAFKAGEEALFTCAELDEYSLNKKWVNVCKGWGDD